MQDINLIRNDIDTYRIVTEIDSLLADITEFKDQICLQGISKDMDPFYGSRRIDEMDHKETDFKHFLFPELDYTNSVIEELNLSDEPLGLNLRREEFGSIDWSALQDFFTHDITFVLDFHTFLMVDFHTFLWIPILFAGFPYFCIGFP